MTRTIPFTFDGLPLVANNVPDEFSITLPTNFERWPLERLVRETTIAWRDQLAPLLEPAMPPRGTLTVGPSTVQQSLTRADWAHELATKIAVADSRRRSFRRTRTG